uniref:Twinfilin-2-A n=1 Tax=Schistocephalus solidus TaxID=70667 RepID=A0A0X3PJQ9_SCHSO
MSLEGYKKHRASKAAPAPLTAIEAEYQLNNETTMTHNSFADVHSSFGGIAFPLTPEATSEVKKFAKRKLAYLQFQIDLPKECINVSQSCEKLKPEAIADLAPANSGSYHLYRFEHTHEGKQLSTLFFIHAIAGYQSSIKERMMYSSCKGALINQLTGQFDLQIEHKLEVEDFKELSTKTFMETAHPVQTDSNVVLQRPKGPGGRGPRRLIT